MAAPPAAFVRIVAERSRGNGGANHGNDASQNSQPHESADAGSGGSAHDGSGARV